MGVGDRITGGTPRLRKVSPASQSFRLVLSGLALANPHVGQGVYTLRLIEGVEKTLGKRLLIVAPEAVAKPAQIPPENFFGLPKSAFSFPGIIQHAFTANRLLRLVAHEFPDAVFHSPGPIVGLTRPAKTIVTLHDCLYRHFSNYHGRFHLRRLLMEATERFARSASLVLTDSEYSRRDLIAKANIPEGKIEVLYPWVGNEFLQPSDSDEATRVRLSLGLPNQFWLYLGGFDYRKNIEFMLAAYAEAAKKRELPPLVLAGRIPDQENPATCDVRGALRRLGLAKEQVILPGAVLAGDLPGLYRAASLLIFPSLMEGFGLPPAEATAVGTPVLSSSAGSLPEVINNPDSLFDPTDAAQLKEKLRRASNDERQFANTFPVEFTEAHGVERYLQLMEEAATGGHRD